MPENSTQSQSNAGNSQTRSIRNQSPDNDGNNNNSVSQFGRGRRSGGSNNDSNTNAGNANSVFPGGSNSANTGNANTGNNYVRSGGRGGRGGQDSNQGQNTVGPGNNVIGDNNNANAVTGNTGDGNRGRGWRSSRGNDANDGPQTGSNQIVGGGNNNQIGNRSGNINNNNNNNIGSIGDGQRGGPRGGRGGRGNQFDGINDGKNADFVNGKWNIGRGRGGDGDHRDWSGKWNNSDRLVVANKIRNDWKGRNWHDDDIPFHGNWWNKHHHSHNHWNHWNFFIGVGNPYYWWTWTPAPRLATWFTWGWPSYYYWDYGPGEYIYCLDGVVYVNGQWFQPAPIYYQQTVQLVESAPVLTPQRAAEVQWLPLGVFAITPDNIADPRMVVQLAVTQDGTIGGTVLNQQTGVSYDVTGAVDKQSQRAVWSYVDQTGARIMMESSIFNLTQAQATGLIHYSPDNIKVVEMVRLEEPANGGGAVGAEAVIDR